MLTLLQVEVLIELMLQYSSQRKSLILPYLPPDRPPDSNQTTLDLVAVVKYATAEGGDCIQVGKFQFFGGNGERCTNYFDWPAAWNSVISGNTYEASVDVSSANYVWPAGIYTVIAN